MSRFPVLSFLSAVVLGGSLLAAPMPIAASGVDASAVDTSKQAKPVLCHGKVATIVGNRRSNRIEGTNRRDVIAGRGGGDLIIGRGGNDLICGGSGGDMLAGLKGRDRLYGGAQKDQCFGERREHRNHHGCEVHRNPLGGPVHHPGHPRTSGASATATPAAHTRSLRGQATADRPYCQTGNINLGRFYFVAGPGNWVAVRPVYATWNDFGGGYGNDVAATDWQLYSAPADGQYYQVNMGSFNLSSVQSIWGYQVYWWDGAQWVDGQLVGISKFDNAGASAAFTYTLGSCVT